MSGPSTLGDVTGEEHERRLARLWALVNKLCEAINSVQDWGGTYVGDVMGLIDAEEHAVPPPDYPNIVLALAARDAEIERLKAQLAQTQDDYSTEVSCERAKLRDAEAEIERLKSDLKMEEYRMSEQVRDKYRILSEYEAARNEQRARAEAAEAEIERLKRKANLAADYAYTFAQGFAATGRHSCGGCPVCMLREPAAPPADVAPIPEESPISPGFGIEPPSDEPCKHDLDRSICLTSNPPQYRCRLCGKTVADEPSREQATCGECFGAKRIRVYHRAAPNTGHYYVPCPACAPQPEARDDAQELMTRIVKYEDRVQAMERVIETKHVLVMDLKAERDEAKAYVAQLQEEVVRQDGAIERMGDQHAEAVRERDEARAEVASLSHYVHAYVKSAARVRVLEEALKLIVSDIREGAPGTNTFLESIALDALGSAL